MPRRSDTIRQSIGSGHRSVVDFQIENGAAWERGKNYLAPFYAPLIMPGSSGRPITNRRMMHTPK